MRDKRRTIARQPYLTKIPIKSTNNFETADIVDGLVARPQAKRTLEGPWVMIVGFALIILIGTVLLKLPIAAAPNATISWEEAFFTATSATTVTGLAVRSTVNDFSLIGQIFILLLLQVGGVGFIAFSVLLYRIIGRRITLQTRFLVQQSLGTNEASGVVKLALYVLGVTVILEVAGAFLLWLRWRQTMPDGEAMWLALFHAISSYCNAGFDLFSGAGRGVLFGYGDDWFTLAVLGGLIVLGGLGITIMYDLWSYRYDRMISLHTKLTLILTVLLTIMGMAIMWADHDYNSPVLHYMSSGKRLAVELFTVVSARTAGVTIVPLEQLSESTQLMLLMSMFIGAAPASMAGGVTTSTVAVLLVAVVATARGHQAAVTFGRTLPLETIAKAVAIMTVSTLLVATVTMMLALRHEGSLLVVAFEVVSAFSNTGYSLNFTSELDSFGRLLIAFTMFWGRLGPLTIVVALTQSEQPTLINYPEEPVIMG
jgi:trk system potassium uptake protein TrkH